MARPFSALPGRLAVLNKQIERGVRRITQKAALAAGSTAVRATRVDTGRARSNWQASLNAPTSTVIPAYAPGNKLGISEAANASGAEAQQRSVINTYRAGSIFITNNVPYIETLDMGGPRVSPGNMTALAVQAALLSVRSTPRVLVK